MQVSFTQKINSYLLSLVHMCNTNAKVNVVHMCNTNARKARYAGPDKDSQTFSKMADESEALAAVKSIFRGFRIECTRECKRDKTIT